MDSDEIETLLDIHGWARATLTQVQRIRAGWAILAGPDPVDDEPPPSEAEGFEALLTDVHFLLIAAHQLLDARKRKVTVALPDIDRPMTKAIERLRPILEHYMGHRAAFFGGEMTKHARLLRELDPDAHPWFVSGDTLPTGGAAVTVAGVLPLDSLDEQVRSVRDAAHEALQGARTRKAR